MTERYPGYDVLTKRWTQSWNEQTRQVIDRRLAVPREPRFFSAAEWRTLERGVRSHHAAAGRRVRPFRCRPTSIRRWPTACWTATATPSCRRRARPGGAAWPRWTQEARDAHGSPFHALSPEQQDELLRRMQHGELTAPAWGGMPCRLFFEHRVIPDITHAYYAHPIAWSEIGFGGPASPRGYVRMGLDRRDPWEAGRGDRRAMPTTRDGKPRMSADPFAAPRAANGRAPGRVPARRLGADARNIAENEPVDFVVVGTGAGGGPLLARLAEERLLGRRFRCRPVFPAAGGFRLRRAGAGKALLDRRAHRRRRQPDHHGRQEQRQGGRRQHGAFRHGVAALPAGMVQVAQRPRLRRRLAARLAGDVGLLRQGRAGAEHFRPGDAIPGDRSARAIPIARTS